MLCTKMKLAVSALTCGPWQAARHLASLAGKVSCVQPRIWPAIQNPQMSQASILSTKQPAQLCGGHMTAFSRPVTSAVHQLLLTRPKLLTSTGEPLLNHQPVRTRIYYERSKGTPETVEDVIQRFFRLNNGMWIRTMAGRRKKLWTKSPRRKQRLRQHIFLTQRQCWKLDHMVNLHYRKPKHYVNDPYAPYHKKTNLPLYRYEPPKFLP